MALRLALLADTPGGSHFFGKLRCGKPMVPTGKSSKKHDSHDTYFVFHHFLIAGRVVRTTQFDAFICTVIMLNTLVTLCFQEGRRWSRLFSGHDIQASITAYACSAFACAQGWRLNHSTWDFSEDTTLVSKALHYQRAAWLRREMHQEGSESELI